MKLSSNVFLGRLMIQFDGQIFSKGLVQPPPSFFGAKHKNKGRVVFNIVDIYIALNDPTKRGFSLIQPKNDEK